MARPLCIDLFCGLGGWAEGFMSEGWDVIGFDNHRHVYGDHKYPAQLVLQDVLTLHGAQFKHAAAIVASPPCQKYSYMAMPWDRAKREIRWQKWECDSPMGDFHLNDLFDACFRIQREASEAAGREIPMVVENVKGAQPWVGSARWHYGSFYLWGDVPALMPFASGTKLPPSVSASIRNGKLPARWTNPQEHYFDGIKIAEGAKNGNDWFASGNDCSLQRRASSRSSARKAASAQIAKIPPPLAEHIARVFKP